MAQFYVYIAILLFLFLSVRVGSSLREIAVL